MQQTSLHKDIEMAKSWGMMVNNLGKYIDKKALLIQNGFPCGNWNENGIGTFQLRPFNVSSLGLIDLTQKKYIEIEKNIKTYQVRYNDIIFTNTNSEILVGRTALWKSNENCVLSNHMSIIRVLNKEELSPSFLAHFLQYQWISGFSKSVCRRHVNQASIGIDKLKALELPEYPISEQRKIAHVLSTVQKAIEQQDNLIRTTTELKKALMQKLFMEGTRGEPQKETEIGLVPESWEVVRIEKVINKTKMRDPHREPNYEFVYVDVSSVSNEFFRIENTTKLLGKDAPSRARKIIRNGDVIFATVRPTLKRIAKITPEFDNQICSTGYCVLQPKTNQITQEFLYQYLQTDFFISKIEKLQRGASYPAVRDADVKNMLIPLPNITEQIEIGNVLKSLDEKSSILIRKKQNLTALFKTLLHELMTGQRRVHELEFEALIKDTAQEGEKHHSHEIE